MSGEGFAKATLLASRPLTSEIFVVVFIELSSRSLNVMNGAAILHGVEQIIRSRHVKLGQASVKLCKESRERL